MVSQQPEAFGARHLAMARAQGPGLHGLLGSGSAASSTPQTTCVDEQRVLPAQCLVHCTVQVIPAHREGVNALSFSCSDLAYVTSSDDGTLKVSRCLFQEQPVRFRPLQVLLGWPGAGRK